MGFSVFRSLPEPQDKRVFEFKNPAEALQEIIIRVENILSEWSMILFFSLTVKRNNKNVREWKYWKHADEIDVFFTTTSLTGVSLPFMFLSIFLFPVFGSTLPVPSCTCLALAPIERFTLGELWAWGIVCLLLDMNTSTPLLTVTLTAALLPFFIFLIYRCSCNESRINSKQITGFRSLLEVYIYIYSPCCLRFVFTVSILL